MLDIGSDSKRWRIRTIIFHINFRWKVVSSAKLAFHIEMYIIISFHFISFRKASNLGCHSKSISLAPSKKTSTHHLIKSKNCALQTFQIARRTTFIRPIFHTFFALWASFILGYSFIVSWAKINAAMAKQHFTLATIRSAKRHNDRKIEIYLEIYLDSCNFRQRTASPWNWTERKIYCNKYGCCVLAFRLLFLSRRQCVSAAAAAVSFRSMFLFTGNDVRNQRIDVCALCIRSLTISFSSHETRSRAKWKQKHMTTSNHNGTNL